MNVLKRCGWCGAAIIASFAVAIALLLMSTLAPHGAETNIAVIAMTDQQAAMTMVATPDQIPRSSVAASVATSATEDMRVFGAVMAIGLLVAVVAFSGASGSNFSSSRRVVGSGLQVMWGRSSGRTGPVTIRAVRSARGLLSMAAATFTATSIARSPLRL